MSTQNEQLYIDLLGQSLSSDVPLNYADLVNSARVDPQQAKEMNWGVARQARNNGLDEIDIAGIIGASPYATAFKDSGIGQVSSHVQAISAWAQQDRMDALAPPLPSGQQRYLELAGIDTARYGMLKELAATDPDRAKSVDKVFAQNAYDANLSPEDFRATLEAGPYTQSLIANKASTLKVNSYLNFHEVSYRNREIRDIRQTLGDKASDIAKIGYQALLVAEKSLFAITPLPINSFKAGIQNVAVPMAATFALSRIPGVTDLVTNAIHLGGSLSASASHAIAGTALAHFTNAASSMLPDGVNKALSLRLPLIDQSMGGLVSAASNAVVLGSSNVVGRVLGEVGVSLAIGNSIVQGASAIASKGMSATFSELRDKATDLINKSQQVFEKANELYTLATGEIFKMETNGRAPEQLNDAQQQYMDLIKDHPQAGKMAYADLAKAYAGDPGEAKFDQNTYVADAAFAQNKSPQEIREIVAASPHLKAALESGENTPAEVESYLSRIEATYQTRLDDIRSQPENKASEQVEEGYSIELNSTPVAKESAEKSEPPIKPTVAQDKSSEEYGYSIQQMLEQRGIQTDRMIINFDGQQKFKMEKGMDNPLTNGLSAKDVELLKQAMSDPDFKGSIKISKGGETLFQRVGGGPPIIDGRQLYKPSIKLEYTSPSQLLYDQSVRDVSSQGLKRVSEIATNAFRSGASLEEVKSAMTAHDADVKAVDARSLDSILTAAQGKAALEKTAQSQAPAPEKTPALSR